MIRKNCKYCNQMVVKVFLVQFAFVALTLACDGAQNYATGNPEVSTSLGRIKGSFMTSRLGKTIYAFRGIRYAEPPTGDLRFKIAVPAKSWSGVFDASPEGPSCPARNGVLTSEDCLRVNVYTTELPTNTSSGNVATGRNKPVMVFIHGGEFVKKSGQSYLNGPEYIMDQDIVLVTINHRLGALGFLATGDSVLPGNLGLKDQVVALRWVKSNIEAFGGDPNCVTLMGYSSGAWAVGLHMVSPMSKGLFHKAIAMGGSPLRNFATHHDLTKYTKMQARIFGCPDDTSSRIVECLKTKSAIEIAKSYPKLQEWHSEPRRIWIPVVEPNIPGIERFLIDEPAKLVREGKINQVPFMTGVTRDEFGYRTTPAVAEARKGNNSEFNDLNENWNYIAPMIYEYERETPRSRRISQVLRNYYFKGEPISVETEKGLAHGYADSVVGFPTHRFIRLVAAVSERPVYYYRFVYQGRYSLKKLPGTQKPYGVSHEDDLQYLFYEKLLPYLGPGTPETPIVEKMTAMWANFAKTGEPIPRNNKAFEDIIWEEFTPENNRYMEIDTTLTMKTGLNGERMQFWESLFFLDPICA